MAGRSAVAELAHQILHIEAMKRPEEGLITNVGIVRGGTAINTVPAEANMEVEVRFESLEAGQLACDSISGLRPVTADITLQVTGGVNRPPFVRDPRQRALYQTAQEVARECGLELGEAETGGGSDASFAQSMGTATLCGLGVEGGGAHAAHEHVLVSRLALRMEFIMRLLQALR